ncbi:ferritin-like domain-containing protein [Methylomonas sp. AM2-LC]|uniref:ferritin-like domain-containing protein n=1 Tax=Methylomonas sp. AM2-LC TaxID=3153301 RepID=UPI0032630CAC
MNNLFDFAAKCLFTHSVEGKLAATHQAWQLHMAQQLCMESTDSPLPIANTAFPEKPEWLMPRDMPRRSLNTEAGKLAFFHALAHIEFMAINLAWDIIYRFRGLPPEFYSDWLRIADEEAQHFSLIRTHMLSLGVDYGDLPAHRGLWLQAEDTANNLLARLAVVPRCMEARGLDVTPAMIDKLKGMNDNAGVDILTRIYQDEIGHVERGSYWFKRLAIEQGQEPESCFAKLLLTYIGKPKGPFNREVRIIAGFSHNEIDWLEAGLHE